MTDEDEEAFRQELEKSFRSPDGIYHASFYVRCDGDTKEIFDAFNKIPHIELLDVSHINASSNEEVEQERAFYDMEEPRMSDQELIESMDRIIENVEVLKKQRDYLEDKVKQED